MEQAETGVPGDFVTGDRLTDILVLPVLIACLIPVLRRVLRVALFQPLGERAIVATSKKTDTSLSPEQVASKLGKWNESCWKMVVYICFTLGGLAVAWGEPWLTDPAHFWLGATHFPLNLHMKSKVLWFYYVETGFYIQAVPFLMFVETRRKDWAESMAHHLITLGLLYYSFYANFARPGVLVMLLHDVSDIFLEAAKLARYGGHQGAALWLFIAFTLSWIVCRIVIFPSLIVQNCLVQPVQFIAMPYNIDPQPHYSIFATLLLVLFFLHVYWTYLILQVIVKQLTQGETSDVREDEDD